MDRQGICEVLNGKVRGKPVAISRFEDKPPTGFDGLKVDHLYTIAEPAGEEAPEDQPRLSQR